MLLEIEKKELPPDITVLTFKGRITLGRESQRMETLVKELQGEGVRKLIFDLASVDYLDSAGLGILTFCYASMKNSGGSFRISGPNGKVMQLLQFTHLDAFLPIYPTLEEACKEF